MPRTGRSEGPRRPIPPRASRTGEPLTCPPADGPSDAGWFLAFRRHLEREVADRDARGWTTA